MKTIINETERLVIEFDSVIGEHQLYPLSKESQVWLVCEQHTFDKPATWRMLDRDIAQPYSLLGGICQKEVIEAEFGARLNGGRHVKAEDYIGLWRKAMLQSISITSLKSRGLSLQCTFTNSTQYLLGMDGEFKAKAEAALSSRFLTARNESQCTWLIPLDSLEACEAYHLIQRQHAYGKYGHLWSSAVNLVVSSELPSVEPVPAYDLFSDMGVAA